MLSSDSVRLRSRPQLPAVTTPQKQWLELIAKQMKATTIVGEATLNNGISKHKGGSQRANKLFDQPIGELLEQFNRALFQ